MRLIKQFIRTVIDYLEQLSGPDQDELVLSLTLNTASLALMKNESVLLSPIRGTCGPISLSGNSLPVFTYRVFEKKLMEFILIRVEVSKPDRISFISTIDSITAPELHGLEVETKEKYKEPFHLLSLHLFRYFPYPNSGGKRAG